MCARLNVRVRGEQPEAEDSRRFQPQNLGEAVRDAVGENVSYPAALSEHRELASACVVQERCHLCRLYGPGNGSSSG